MSLVQLVAVHARRSAEHHVFKLDKSAISAEELGVVTKRVGGSSRVWSVEFVKERREQPGDKVCAELYRVRELVSPQGHVDIRGDQSKLNGKGKGKRKKKGGKNAASTGAVVPPAPTSRPSSSLTFL